jgi:hypothetical protein
LFDCRHGCTPTIPPRSSVNQVVYRKPMGEGCSPWCRHNRHGLRNQNLDGGSPRRGRRTGFRLPGRVREAGLTAVTIGLEVIVCTCNRASELERMLAALASQSQAKDVVWSVLVVDNGSTDATAKVVESWRARGTIPGLRSLLEPDRGLTPARLREFERRMQSGLRLLMTTTCLRLTGLLGWVRPWRPALKLAGSGVESLLIGFRHAPTTSRTSAGALPNKIMGPRCVRWIT